MPTEMLQTEDASNAATLPAAPSCPILPGAVPLRILNKRPEYFRQQAENCQPKRLSAVERLEADKAKYVKSQEVINAKQEPIKAAPIHGPRRAGSSPALRASKNNSKSEVGAKCINLNLEILCNLLNSSEGCGGGLGYGTRSWIPQRSRSSELRRRSFAESMRVFPLHAANLSASLLRERTAQGPLQLSLSSSDLRLHLRTKPGITGYGPLLPCLHMPSESQATDLTSPRRPSLTRSKSDLSERYTRAGADMERFFNYCGLEPRDLEGLGMVESFTRAHSDMISLNFHSASMKSSDCDQSLHSNENLTDDGVSAEHMPYGISAVERNARIIKWLYSIKQARESSNGCIASNKHGSHQMTV